MAPWSSWKETDKDMETISEQVRQNAEENLRASFDVYLPLVYKNKPAEQGGYNYILKLYVGDNKFVILSVWKPDDPSKNPRLTKSEMQDLGDA